MHIVVEDETVYSYGAPARSIIQYLRLTPRQHANQSVRAWQVPGLGKFTNLTDRFGNIVNLLSLTEPHEAIVLRGRREVQTLDSHGVLLAEYKTLQPAGLHHADPPDPVGERARRYCRRDGRGAARQPA